MEGAPGRLAIGDFAAVIFDCDGVLVDSEPISARTLVQSLGECNYRIDEAYVYRHYLGRSFATIETDFLARTGLPLSGDFRARWHTQLFDAFRRDLRPIRGIRAVLDSLTLPYAVVSSSAPDRLGLSLEVTGLAAYFGDRVFDASMVERGKPAPDLFLLAARHLGGDPGRMLAIEDSRSGVEAARMAGMTVWGFTGGGHFVSGRSGGNLLAAGAALVFDDMRRIQPPPGNSPLHEQMLKR